MKIPPYPPLVKGGGGDFHIKTFLIQRSASAHRSCVVPCVLIIFLFFIAVHPSPAAAASDDMKIDNSPIITITKEQHGRQITASLGSLIQIELPFLGSAGYGWHVETSSSDYIELFLEETKKILPADKIGGPVMGIWRFRTVKPGRTEIRMACYRAWEGPDAATDHFTIKIEIE
jgi:predicted secreted protein